MFIITSSTIIFSNPMESKYKMFAFHYPVSAHSISGTRRGVLFSHVNEVWTPRVTFITDDCASACDGSGGGGGGGGGEGDACGPCGALLNV